LFSPLGLHQDVLRMAAAAIRPVNSGFRPPWLFVSFRGKIIPEHKNPINRFLIWVYLAR